MNTRFDEVSALLQLYFDGLYAGDAGLLERVFHADAVYATATSYPVVRMDMATYLPMVAARPSPQSLDQPRRDEIVSIAFAGPNTALATVRCAIAPRHFTDFLSLIRTPDGWRIIAKVFHYDVEESA